MALPSNRNSKGRARMRRAHHAMKKVALADCKACGEKRLPHAACPGCGTYAGRKVVAKKDPLAKRKKASS